VSAANAGIGGRRQQVSALTKHLTAITVRRTPGRRLDLQPVARRAWPVFKGTIVRLTVPSSEADGAPQFIERFDLLLV